MSINVTLRARNLFAESFGSHPASIGSAPGRVELLGNHTDYNGGFVLTAAVDIRTSVAICESKSNVTRIVTELPGTKFAEIILSDGAQGLTTENKWAGYVAGVLDYFTPVGTSWDVAITSDVPDGSGISSSAAVLVATASAITTLLGQSFSPMEIAVACRAVENGPWVGAPVGLLDQFSSACGERGMALFLDCKSSEWKRVPLCSESLCILIVNTNVKHALADGGGYTTRRSECELAVNQLSHGRTRLLRDVTDEEFVVGIDKVLQPFQNRARHVWNENARVVTGTKCLESGDLTGFGEQLNASHNSCRELFENTCSEIDLVQLLLSGMPGVYGAKLSGGGWGGSVVAVVDPAKTDEIVHSLESEYGSGLSILSTFAADGMQGELV